MTRAKPLHGLRGNRRLHGAFLEQPVEMAR